MKEVYEEEVNYSSIINALKYKDRAMNIKEFAILSKSKEEYSFHSLHRRIHVGCVPGSAGGSLQQSPYVATYNLLTTDMSLASLRIGHRFDIALTYILKYELTVVSSLTKR